MQLCVHKLCFHTKHFPTFKCIIVIGFFIGYSADKGYTIEGHVSSIFTLFNLFRYLQHSDISVSSAILAIGNHCFSNGAGGHGFDGIGCLLNLSLKLVFWLTFGSILAGKTPSLPCWLTDGVHVEVTVHFSHEATDPVAMTILLNELAVTPQLKVCYHCESIYFILSHLVESHSFHFNWITSHNNWYAHFCKHFDE